MEELWPGPALIRYRFDRAATSALRASRYGASGGRARHRSASMDHDQRHRRAWIHPRELSHVPGPILSMGSERWPSEMRVDVWGVGSLAGGGVLDRRVLERVGPIPAGGSRARVRVDGAPCRVPGNRRLARPTGGFAGSVGLASAAPSDRKRQRDVSAETQPDGCAGARGTSSRSLPPRSIRQRARLPWFDLRAVRYWAFELVDGWKAGLITRTVISHLTAFEQPALDEQQQFPRGLCIPHHRLDRDGVHNVGARRIPVGDLQRYDGSAAFPETFDPDRPWPAREAQGRPNP